jgi:hypothetical protein
LKVEDIAESPGTDATVEHAGAGADQLS